MIVTAACPKIVRSYADADFLSKLHEAIVSFQDVGWEVEIHYQMDKGLYSALVIPRRTSYA